MTSIALENRRVLVLNKLWTAIRVVNLPKALGLLFGEYENSEPKAKIVDPFQNFQTFTWEDWSKLKPLDGESAMASARSAFKIPEVIMLTQYDEMPENRVRFSRRSIHRRDEFKCQYCNKKVGEDGTIAHVIPKSKGGLTTWENCVLACVQCNSQKANRRPEEAFKGKIINWIGPSPMKLLSVPKKPKFSVLRGERYNVPKSWKSFLADPISEAYWEVELDNDN